MKYIAYLLITASLVSCSEYDYDIEDRICDCYYAKGDSLGIDFRRQIKQAEKQLISERILDDSTGNSFLKTYKSIVDSGSIWFCHLDLRRDLVHHIQ